MTPLDAMAALDSRLWDIYGAGVNPWVAGAGLIAGRMGMDSALALEGSNALEAAFARVMQGEDPRRFRVATDAERQTATPALVLYAGPGAEEDDDLIALSLRPESKRFWRMTCRCSWLGSLAPDASGVLRLRQDVHGYFGGLLKAAAHQRRGRQEGRSALERGLLHARRESGVECFAEAILRPADDVGRAAYVGGLKAAIRAQRAAEERWAVSARAPGGAVILDPVGLDWTRRGVLGDAEWIEIIDAPEDGPLGRALRRLNPRIGTKHGVPLTGQVAARPKISRRAA
jgi:hypothetical protein